MSTKRAWGRIERRPGGRYRSAYTHRGILHRAEQSFPTKLAAEGWLAAERRLIDLGQWNSPADRKAAQQAADAAQTASQITFGSYCEEVLERRLADGKIRPTTAALYQRLIRLHLSEFASVPLDQITVRQVNLWHSSMAGTPASQSNAYGIVRMVFAVAVRDELLDSSPCRVETTGKHTARNTADEVLEPSELDAYLSHVPERAGYRMAATLCYWCGLRSGEVRGLRRRDIDVKLGTLTVSQAVVKVDGRNMISREGKTAAAHRVVAIPPHILPELRQWLDAQPVRGRDALLFVAPDGRPMSGESLRAACKAAAVAVGRPTLRVHSLRHSSATMFARTGATSAELQARFGWTSPAMAAKYSHASAERDKTGAARLSAMVAG